MSIRSAGSNSSLERIGEQLLINGETGAVETDVMNPPIAALSSPPAQGKR